MTEIIPAEKTGPEAVESGEVTRGTPVYADITESGRRHPIIPDAWRRGNLRATVAQHAGHRWYKARFHGVRLPLHTLMTCVFAVRGACRLTSRLFRWWHWPEGWQLESMAVAQGRAGHADAMRVHKEGKQTRSQRGQIIGLALAAAVVAGYVAANYAPLLAWLAAAPVVVVVLARFGKPVGKPMFQPAIVDARYEKLTPDIIVRALGSLSVTGIDKWLRDGREIMFVSPVTRDGPGWRVAIDLPFGVTFGEVLDRREKLASGLRRPLGCVWPEGGGDDAHEGRLVLYVCDEPLSKARQPAWPLAKAGRADIFAPIPYGTDQRGRLVTIELMFANLLVGSIPRRGKTVAQRNVLLAAALDPITELRVFELKGTGDLEPVARCCHHYGSGADDDTIAAALDSMRQLVDVELVRRAKTIRELGKDACPDSKVTPELSRRKSLRLHPIVFDLDECQEAFSHEVHGPLFEKYALALIKRGPALGIMLVLGTQRPDSKSLPTGVTTNASLRFCLQVMDQLANDMVLGTSSYKRGIRATLFTVNDKGCGYLVGAADHPQITKTFNINGKQAEVIAARARVAREQAGTLTGYALGETDDSLSRDVLGDVLAVFGAQEPGLHWTTVAERLAERFPDRWANTTDEAISAQCRGMGVASVQVKVGGRNLQGCRRLEVEQAAGRP